MFFQHQKIKIDKALYQRLADIAQAGGYSTTDEFILHILERELARLGLPEQGASADEVGKRLRGLGYIE